MRRSAIGLVLLALFGCARANAEGDFEQLGLKFSSSELPPGLYPPVTPSDLAGVAERGAMVHRMERALMLGYEDAMFRAGDPHALAVLPLVDIDPGGESGQVVFVKWPTPPGDVVPPLSAETAQRWLLASLRLSPDSVIDVELLQGPLGEDSHEARRVTSLLAAAEAFRSKAPGGVFHMLDLYEVVPSDKKGQSTKTVAHVYALSADGDGPDLEAVVDQVSKRGAPEVLSLSVTHPAGAGMRNPITVNAPSPGPLTVARALLQGASGSVGVVTDDQQRWSIDAKTGAVARAEAGAPEPSSPPEHAAPAPEAG